ncbi:MAG: hypothetical protein WDW38_007971 [Sanguina aurantia]
MMSSPPRTVRRSLPWLLAALSMVGPFSMDAVFPAFPLIGARFAVDDTALQQMISVYLVAYGTMSLFHGAISDAIGRKPVIVTGMVVYALASIAAAVAVSYPMLLACRGVQGMCAGAGLVVGRALIRDTFQGADAQRLMSQVMMIFGVAPVIAPMVGALLLTFGGWHGIFWVLTAFTGLLALALVMLLEESHPPSQRSSFAPRPLLASYLSFGRDRAFWPLLISSSVNFAGLVRMSRGGLLGGRMRCHGAVAGQRAAAGWSGGCRCRHQGCERPVRVLFCDACEGAAGRWVAVVSDNRTTPPSQWRSHGAVRAHKNGELPHA